jgi:cobalt-zinc-cadmium efflux system outer membrane protein
VDTARAEVARSTVELEIARIDAAAETARRFLDGLAYQAWLRHAEQGVRLAEEAVAAVGRRVGAGAAPAAELARAEAELVRAELRYEDYEHELASAYRRLGAQWGETEPDFAVVVGMLESLPRVDSLDSLIARIDANPDIARLVSEQRIRETQVALARAQSRPSWRVSGGLRRNESTDDFGLVGSITVPLRLGNRNQGRIAEARAGLARTEAEAVAASVDIETELFVLHQALEHDIHIAGRLVADVVPRLQSALGDARRSFELGRSSYLELRAVQTELLDVNAELLEAYTDAHRLTIEIERLTGASISPSVTQ